MVNLVHSFFSFFFVLLLWLISPATLTAQVHNIQCDAGQKQCTFISRRFIIGDKIVVTNIYREIVARGEVVKLQGERRLAKLSQVYGDLRDSLDIRLVDVGKFSDDSLKLSDRAREYRGFDDQKWGLSASLGTMNIATDAFAFGFQGYYAQAWKHNFFPFAKVKLALSSGEAKGLGINADSVNYAVTVFSGDVGVTYPFLRQYTIRPEVGFGVGFVYGFVDISGTGDNRSLQKAPDGFSFSIDPHFRLNFEKELAGFKPFLEASFQFVGEMNYTSFGLGVFRSL